MHSCDLKCNSHFCFVLEHISACLRFRRVFCGFHGQSWVEVGKMMLRLWGMTDGGVHMESTVTLIWVSRCL